MTETDPRVEALERRLLRAQIGGVHMRCENARTRGA